MANINEIAKETLILLRQRGLKPTPENYTEIFEELARKYKFSGGTKEKIDKFKSLLIPAFQAEVKDRNFKNLDEFLSFAISKINRLGTTKDDKFFNLLKTILTSLLVSKDKKVKEIASMSLTRVSKAMEEESIFLLEKKWQEFQKKYETLELDLNLQKYGIKNEDFYQSIKKLLFQLELRSYEKFAQLISLCLQPSLAQNKSIDNFIDKLEQKPYILADEDFKNNLLECVHKRMNYDKMFVEKNLIFFDKNLQKLSQMLDQIQDFNQASKAFIDTIDKDTPTIELIKEKFDILDEKINAIVTQLNFTADEKQREGYDAQSLISYLDECYQKKKISNYALCLFSIMNYRFIMEKYGVGNLNEIFVRFKKTLQEHCAKEDDLWMIDEKSYLMVVKDKDYEQVSALMQSMKSIVDNFRFIYKQEVINVSVKSTFIDKQSYPHINLFEELLKKL